MIFLLKKFENKFLNLRDELAANLNQQEKYLFLKKFKHFVLDVETDKEFQLIFDKDIFIQEEFQLSFILEMMKKEIQCETK